LDVGFEKWSAWPKNVRSALFESISGYRLFPLLPVTFHKVSGSRRDAWHRAKRRPLVGTLETRGAFVGAFVGISIKLDPWPRD